MIEIKRLERYYNAINEDKAELIKRGMTPRRRVIFYEKLPPYGDNMVVDEHIIYTCFYNQFRADMKEKYPHMHYTISDDIVLTQSDFNTHSRHKINNNTGYDYNNLYVKDGNNV